jgi:Fur family ferric uptake transcriptional regulator
MSSDHLSHIFNDHQLRKTPTRVAVLKLLVAANYAMSSSDIEAELPDMDRITLYRTLKTFEDQGIVHQAVDGTNKAKYALCSSDCDEHEHHDDHAHFHCEKCGTTTCLEGVQLSPASLPTDLKVTTTNILLKGKCEMCR